MELEDPSRELHQLREQGFKAGTTAAKGPSLLPSLRNHSVQAWNQKALFQRSRYLGAHVLLLVDACNDPSTRVPWFRPQFLSTPLTTHSLVAAIAPLSPTVSLIVLYTRAPDSRP